jgi:hypothetical protein
VDNGYAQLTQYPVNLSQDLVIRYENYFRIELVRDSKASINLNLSQAIGLLSPTLKRIEFSQMVYYLTNGEEYVLELFWDIGRYQPGYKKKIKGVSKKFFDYFEEISNLMVTRNFDYLYDEIQKIVPGMLQAGGYIP